MIFFTSTTISFENSVENIHFMLQLCDILTLYRLNLEKTHLTLQENCSCFALLNW